MADLTEDLAGLVDSIVRPLVDEPDALEVTSVEAEDGGMVIEIRVAEGDAGKVIGRVIKAIRTLARAAASRSGKMVDVELID